MPKKVTLLNNQMDLDASIDLLPFYWREKPYLRIKNIPVNDITDEVLVIKIDESINE